MDIDLSAWRRSTRPGSDIWYPVGDPNKAHRVKECTGCGSERMIPTRQRFCSVECRSEAHPPPDLTGRRIDAPTYAGAHKRVQYEKGRAAEYPCVDCPEQADHWSYDGLDPHELTEGLLSYSTDPHHYQPRCASCHARYDGFGSRQRDLTGRFT
jgi:hypothetical protein